jgi:hypothetical protein
MTYPEAFIRVRTIEAELIAAAPDKEFMLAYALGGMMAQAAMWLWELETVRAQLLDKEAKIAQLQKRLEELE